VHRADRLLAGDRRCAAAVQVPAHVDDRDVEVADPTHQLQPLLAVGGLDHLEGAAEGFADPEPDERVTVDH